MFYLITITIPFLLFVSISDLIVLLICIYDSVMHKSDEEIEREMENCPQMGELYEIILSFTLITIMLKLYIIFCKKK